MGTTPNYKIPYVEPSDALVSFPTTDKLAAEAVDKLPLAVFINARLTASQSVPNAVVTAVTLAQDAAEPAPATDWFTIVNGEIAVAKAGLYHIAGSATFVANATGVRNVYIQMNSSVTVHRTSVPGNAVQASATVGRTLRLAAGTVIGLWVYQTSGVALNLDSSNRQCLLDIVRVAT